MRTALIFKHRRGQVLVLAAFTTLLVAICLFMTISISWQVRNRIQLQHAADAKAFSDATMVARAYNSLAYSNRAIAGNVVAMTILHSFHSEISAANDLYFSLMQALNQAIAFELAKSTKCFPLIGCVPCFYFWHCIPHKLLFQLDQIRAMLAWIGGRMGSRIRPLDPPFIEAIESIDDSISVLNSFQDALKTDLLLSGLSDQNSTINRINMTSGSAKSDFMAITDTTISPFETSLRQKRLDLTDVVNAARPSWVRDRGIPGINGSSEQLLSPLFGRNGPFRQLLGNTWVSGSAVQSVFTFNGGAGFYQSQPSIILPGILTNLLGHPRSQIRGAHVSSFDGWQWIGFVRHGCTWPIGSDTPMLGDKLSPAIVTSNSGGGRHRSPALLSIFNNVHRGRHTVNSNNSFFDLAVYSTDAEQDNGWLQPGSYAGFTTNSLSRAFDRQSSAKNPWDLKIKVSLPVEGSINLENSTANSDAGQAKAVSKAMTYYHHPGNWKEPPNFWNPFWRAKLHPYSSSGNDFIHLIMAGGSEAMLMLFTQ